MIQFFTKWSNSLLNRYFLNDPGLTIYDSHRFSIDILFFLDPWPQTWPSGESQNERKCLLKALKAYNIMNTTSYDGASGDPKWEKMCKCHRFTCFSFTFIVELLEDQTQIIDFTLVFKAKPSFVFWKTLIFIVDAKKWNSHRFPIVLFGVFFFFP